MTVSKYKKIILIGFMGSGKSTIGKALADNLSIPFIEMDDRIIQRSGYPTVREIFEQEGEATFRQIEREVAAELSVVNHAVISTGGGVVQNHENLASLRENSGTVIFLRTPFEVLQSRIAHDDSRPLFRDIVQARNLFEIRLPLYERNADIIVDTEGVLPQDLAQKISEKLTARGVSTQ